MGTGDKLENKNISFSLCFTGKITECIKKGRRIGRKFQETTLVWNQNVRLPVASEIRLTVLRSTK